MLTLALIGHGRWGQHIRQTLETLPEAQLAYIETTGWQKLLRVPQLDGVLIATPASTHAAIAAPFIERGVPTFIEKPLTADLASARALARLAARKKTPVMVGHVHLYNPAYDVAKRLARRTGRLRYIFGEGMNNGPYRDDVSCLWDWAPHDLALCLNLLGKMPTAIRATGSTLLRKESYDKLYDFVTLALRFPQGVVFHGIYSWLAPEKRKKITIVGSRDAIVFNDTAARKVTRFAGFGPLVRAGRLVRREPTISHPPVPPAPPLTRELAAFLRMVRTGQRPASDLTLGVQTIRILDAAERSLRAQGAWVRLR